MEKFVITNWILYPLCADVDFELVQGRLVQSNLRGNNIYIHILFWKHRHRYPEDHRCRNLKKIEKPKVYLEARGRIEQRRTARREESSNKKPVSKNIALMKIRRNAVVCILNISNYFKLLMKLF